VKLEELDYALPPELIAQEPAPERTAARLLVVERQREALAHETVAALPRLLRPGDVLVLNDARVVPARVHGRRPSGGRLELLLLEERDGGEWDALVRGSPRVGERVHLAGATGTWTGALGDGRWRLRLEVDGPVSAWLERAGELPLPPYIRRPDGPTAVDRERYQTTFARVPGAVAAPTAGLHFTPGLLAEAEQAGVAHATLTLHVGPGTFLPARGGDLETHRMTPERYELPAATVARIEATRGAGGRVVAVGTTTVRALESSAADGRLAAGSGEAALFIRPGHRFQVVDVLLTNLHLPGTPLLALVAAFAGRGLMAAAYAEAVRQRYRFYSYGDAMLIT
jgi:S-adenosylmethionine:tRNA ribosyltransferase-isomerase